MSRECFRGFFFLCECCAVSREVDILEGPSFVCAADCGKFCRPLKEAIDVFPCSNEAGGDF